MDINLLSTRPDAHHIVEYFVNNHPTIGAELESCTNVLDAISAIDELQGEIEKMKITKSEIQKRLATGSGYIFGLAMMFYFGTTEANTSSMTDFNEIESMIQEKISTCSAQEEIKDITVNLEKAEDTSEDSVNKEVVKKTKKEIVKAVKTENIIEEPSTNTVTSDKILEKKKATSQSEQQGKTETYHVGDVVHFDVNTAKVKKLNNKATSLGKEVKSEKPLNKNITSTSLETSIQQQVAAEKEASQGSLPTNSGEIPESIVATYLTKKIEAPKIEPIKRKKLTKTPSIKKVVKPKAEPIKRKKLEKTPSIKKTEKNNKVNVELETKKSKKATEGYKPLKNPILITPEQALHTKKIKVNDKNFLVDQKARVEFNKIASLDFTQDKKINDLLHATPKFSKEQLMKISKHEHVRDFFDHSYPILHKVHKQYYKENPNSVKLPLMYMITRYITERGWDQVDSDVVKNRYYNVYNITTNTDNYFIKGDKDVDRDTGVETKIKQKFKKYSSLEKGLAAIFSYTTDGAWSEYFHNLSPEERESTSLIVGMTNAGRMHKDKKGKEKTNGYCSSLVNQYKNINHQAKIYQAFGVDQEVIYISLTPGDSRLKEANRLVKHSKNNGNFPLDDSLKNKRKITKMFNDKQHILPNAVAIVAVKKK